jgi:glycosyltransferase involved in cell wall biosynthesis
MEPLVSIIIPVYNRGELIKETLDSVFYQTYTNWECIIVDDGSTDDTWITLQNYELKDNRFKIFKRQREPKGASVCRNIGIEQATGDFLIFSDSDDLLLKETLISRVSHIKTNIDKYDVFIFDTLIFNEKIGDDNRKWNILITNENDLIRFLHQDMPWSISGSTWKKGSIINFKEDALSFQDWEFHIRMILHNIKYIKIEDNNCAIFYRKNNNYETISSNTFTKNQLVNRSELIIFISNLLKTNKNIEVRFSISKQIGRAHV